MELLWILAATLSGGVLSVVLAAFFAFRMTERVARQLVAFAIGVMLSAACLDILPEAQEMFSSQATHAEHAHGPGVFATLLGGFLLFYVLERLALWRHAHHDCDHHPRDTRQSAAVLILIGDAFHNFVDGLLIAAAFLTSPELGVATTLAIIAHEVPQEIGDFVVLLNAGWQKKKALLANALSSLSAVLGGVLGYFVLDGSQTVIPHVLTLAAASFIYIAIADLLPMLHQQRDTGLITQAGWLSCGIVLIPAIMGILPAH